MAHTKPLWILIGQLVDDCCTVIDTRNPLVVERRDSKIATLDQLVKDWMPSGSGIDAGTKLELGNCRMGKVVFTFGYHHMNENGFYT